MNRILKITLITLCTLLPPQIYALQKTPTLVFQIIQDELLLNRSTIESAKMLPLPKSARTYSVEIKLRPQAAEQFTAMTRHNIGKKLSFIFNNEVITTATIQQDLGSEIVLTGLTKRQAKRFVKFFD